MTAVAVNKCEPLMEIQLTPQVVWVSLWVKEPFNNDTRWQEKATQQLVHKIL